VDHYRERADETIAELLASCASMAVIILCVLLALVVF